MKPCNFAKVYFGHAQLGGNIAATSAKIAGLFDYIILGPEDYYFLGQSPQPLRQINNIFYPLDPLTWILLSASIVCTTTVLICIHKSHKAGIFHGM